MRLSSLAIAFLLLAAIAFAGNDSPIAGQTSTVNGTKTRYALPRGATLFVIRLTDRAERRSFTFVNENAAAEGELSIAVSEQSLVADSPQWRTVGGKIRFRHKRLFKVSLVGVEANYVRLIFQVKGAKENTRGDFAIDRARPKDVAALSAPALLRNASVEHQPATAAVPRP